jgi:hypothetical protein
VFETREPLSGDEGYFRVGSTPCYGRSGDGVASNYAEGTGLPESFLNVAPDRRVVGLPFDPSEVATNLREERYRQPAGPPGRRLTGSEAVRRLYYLLRPRLPVGIRKRLQRVHFSGWRHIGFPRWPVDASLDSLMRRLMAAAVASRGGDPVPFIWFWPDGAPACAIVTHDVEGPGGREFCPRLMEFDEAAGITSAFQVVPDAPWETTKAGTRSFIEFVRRRGFEVNVHDLNHDGHLFRDRALFDQRVAEINRYARELGCRGFRAGAMYRRQDWFDAFEISYDMSVPSVAHLEPQRGGCCTVMPYFVGNLLELPLTTSQDYTLFHILDDYSTTLWDEQISVILEHHGLASFIVHPDYLAGNERAQAVYRELLEYLGRLREERNLWIALPGEVDRWWRDRREMRLVADGDSWRIEGPGSGRARLAWARPDGDGVAYDVEPSPAPRNRGDLKEPGGVI